MRKAIIFCSTFLMGSMMGVCVAGTQVGRVVVRDYNGPRVLSVSGVEVTNAIAIAAGYGHFLVLRNDGTVVGCGRNNWSQALGYDPCESTNGIVKVNGSILSNVAAIATGQTFSIALEGDGTLVGWGEARLTNKFTNIVAISAGMGHWLALAKDGTILASETVRVPKGLSNVIAVAANKSLSVWDSALLRDGTVAQWDVSGYHPGGPLVQFTNRDANGTGHVDMGYKVQEYQLVEGLSNAMGIAAGSSLNLAVRRDRTVFRWLLSDTGGALITNSADSGPVMLNGEMLGNVLSVAVGGDSMFPGYGLALKGDGSTVLWGSTHLDPPEGLTNVVAIDAGAGYWLAITTSTNLSNLTK